MMRSMVVFASVMLCSSFAAAGEFDGTWSGKWGGNAPGQIQVQDDRVVAYRFKGQAQFVGKTKIAGKTLTFGNATYTIKMTMAGGNKANASYRGRFGPPATGTFIRN